MTIPAIAKRIQPNVETRPGPGSVMTEVIQHPQVSALTPEAKREQFWGNIWRLQRALWRVTALPRLRGCHRWRAPGAAEVGLTWQGEGSARWNGLQNSRSIWASPLAAVRMGMARQQEVSTAVSSWLDQGEAHTVMLLTLTVRHNASQSLELVWDAVSGCWNGVTGTAAWRGKKGLPGDRRTYGIGHHIRAVETTTGSAGYHVHTHALLLLERPLSGPEREELTSRLFARWSSAAVRAGLEAPEEDHGIDLAVVGRPDATTAARYLVKGLASEVTGGAGKSARGNNRTPFQVLEDIADALDRGEEPDPADLAIWAEWESSSSGRRQLLWSRGAKSALGVDDVADADLPGEEEQDTPEAEVVATIDGDTWRTMSDDTALRQRILAAVAGARSADEARRNSHVLLSDLGINHTVTAVQLYDHEGHDRLPTHRQALSRDLRTHLLRSES